MDQVFEFFRKLFDSSDWPPRWHCGQWTEFHGWLYIISDLLIWSSYFTIPIIIIKYISKKKDIRFVRLYFLFAAFILSCGATHFLDALAFWIPAYRLNGLFRLVTGVVSWVTVFYVIKNLPVIFSTKPQKALENEIEQRIRSEEKFRGLLEAAPDAMVIANEKGIIVLINRQTEKLFGHSRQELIGKPVEILIPAEFRAKHEQDRTHYFAEPKVRSMGAGLALFAIRKDGTQIPVEISLSPLVTEDGTLISASVRDITERKKSEAKFKGLLEAAPDAMVIANEKGMIVLINRQTEKLFGYSRQELIGKPVEILVPAEFHTKHVQDRTHYFAEPKVRSMGAGLALFANRKDGTQIPVEISLSPLVTEDGTLISASIRDISERKKSEEKFRALLEAAPDAMVISNDKGEIVLSNRQTEMLFGYSKEELTGKPVEILIPAKFHHKHVDHRTRYFADPRVRSMGVGLELFAIRKDGIQIPVEISLSPLVTEEGTLISASIRDITERKRAEEKLRKAKKDFQLLVSSIKDYAIVLLDENGLVASWNSGAENIKGYTAEEIIGQPMDIFYTTEELATGEPGANLKSALENGRFETEGLRVRKNGSTFYANILYTSLFNEEGRLYGYAQVTRDITEKRKAEESIRFLATIANNIQDPVISTDTHSNIISWNRAAEILLEWKSEEVLGKNGADILRVNYLDERRELILEALNKKNYWQGEVIYHTKSGKALNVLITASQILDARGNMTGHLALVRDITERKKTEQELSNLNNELEQRVKERTATIVKTLNEKNIILESIGDAFFAVDKTWTVTYWNRIAEVSLGVGKQQIVGKNLWDVFSGSLDSKSFHEYHRAMTSGQVVHFEDYHPAVKKWYEISAYPSDNGLSVYFKDVTESLEAHKEIRRLNLELESKVAKRTEELQAANREMEAFTYSVSHDLRAPLRGIIGFTSILEEDYASQLDDEARRITSVIRNSTLKMGHLIDDLLTFSRTGKKELVKTEINTNAMVMEVVADLLSQHKDGHKINWSIRDLPEMKADLSSIRQVWINLISNAIKYSVTNEHPVIAIAGRQENGHYVFDVKDNGVGFDENYKDKLFKVFQRLHSADEFEGTGVGLALVEKIVSRHGGKVWAEGKVGEGACFSFALPA